MREEDESELSRSNAKFRQWHCQRFLGTVVFSEEEMNQRAEEVALRAHTGPYGAVGLYLPYIYPISTLYLPYIYLWCGRPGESLPEP